jgi:hypothetical protein
MGFLVMGILLFLGIVGGFSAVSWLIGSTYEAGGVFGILGLVALCVLGMWIASVAYNDKGKQ